MLKKSKKKSNFSDNMTVLLKEFIMSNALTGITNYQGASGLNAMSDIRSSISSAKKGGSVGIRTFQTLLEEKIYNNGQMNESKLNKQEKKLYNSCVEMESLLWKQVLNTMKKTIIMWRWLRIVICRCAFSFSFSAVAYCTSNSAICFCICSVYSESLSCIASSKRAASR